MMLQRKTKPHYSYDLDYNDKTPQSQKRKTHQYATIIGGIVKINNVVNIKNYDDNDWTFKGKVTTLKMYQKNIIKKSNDEKHQLWYESIISR